MKLSPALERKIMSDPTTVIHGRPGKAPNGPAKASKPPRGMNKTEARMAAVLDGWKRDGTIDAWAYEGWTIKLARDTRYTPDFWVWKADRVEFIEVKGFFRDDAKVKIKVAARMYPMFTFYVCRWAKDHFEWERIYP